MHAEDDSQLTVHVVEDSEIVDNSFCCSSTSQTIFEGHNEMLSPQAKVDISKVAPAGTSQINGGQHDDKQ